MKFKADGLKIRDSYGRQRIFRGVNICFKMRELGDSHNKKFNKIDKKLKDIFPSMVQTGVNIVRLGFTWAMVEPLENQYDERAIEYLKGYIKKCEQNNIYVVLDCHQDLFYCNKGIGDGAPKWISADYSEKKPIAIWAEGYFYMNDIQRAFNDFWANKNDMQGKFVCMWNKIADEFKGFKNVIAYDYFNEPMINDNSNNAFCKIVNGTFKEGLGVDFDAKKYYQNGAEKSGFAKMSKDIALKMKSFGNAKAMLNAMDNYNKFGTVIKQLDEYVVPFNKNCYEPFFNKMVNECGDDEHFNLFEHSYYSNLGVPFDIEYGKNSIYSPHAYDIFIDSPLYNKYSSNDRIKYIIDGISANQQKMQVPVIMGEWGGGANGTEWIKHIDYVYSLLEQHQWSNIYWGYRFLNKEFVKTMNRPYPVAVCGDIISYSTNSKTRQFELKYNNDDNINAKTIIYVPNKGFVEFENRTGINEIKLSY